MSRDDSRLDGQGRLVIVTGMQFGSEGKGAITSYLAPAMSMGVRTGAANAGHTIYFRGQKFTMQQIPCAWVNPCAQIVVGVGALISLPILLREIELVEEHLPLRDRLFIDGKAHVIQDAHIRTESMGDLEARIGSTSAIAREGIGVATAAKVMRETSCVQARDVLELKPFIADTVDLVNDDLDQGGFVQLEGTQGFGLSLEHGHFPFVTSRDTTAPALAASVGVNASAFSTEVIGVVRTYPIRVHGPSGPFDHGSEELSWEEVGKRAGAKESIAEYTSVTKKMRRVATFSMEGFERACRVNRPTEIALTFADYLDWSVHEKESLSPSIERFMHEIEEVGGAPVTLVKTGPCTTVDLSWYRRSMLRKVAT